MKLKYVNVIVAGLMLAAVVTGCGNKDAAKDSSTNISAGVSKDKDTGNENNVDTINTKNASGKVLVAYFTAAENSDVDVVSSASVTDIDGEKKGRMTAIAEMIQEKTGGDLFSIKTSVEYPGDGGKLIDYAQDEQDNNARPELISHIDDFENYDVVFVGYPTWWYDLPQVMYSFFDEYDFSGKTIVPFNSHNGSRFSGTIQTIEELEPDAEVLEDGFTVSESDIPDAKGDINDWLEGLDY